MFIHGRTVYGLHYHSFVGSHLFASFTPEQCYNKIKVCRLHFAEGSFLQNNSRTRLRYDAVPSLNLATVKSESCIKMYNDASQQTCMEEKVFEGKSTQTPMRLLVNTPRERILKEEIKVLKQTMRLDQCRKKLDTGIPTKEDVYKYLENNYSEQSCKFLKTQLNLLSKSSRGCRYSNEMKKFALTIYFLGPKAYKKISTIYRLPSKATLNRFTKQWTVNPGFNEFIFCLIKCRSQLLNEKEKDCILCLDEISLKPHLFYDISKDKIIGFQESYTDSDNNKLEVASKALVIMARGIATSWKQPVAYFFYKSMTPSNEIKDILFECVRKLNIIGLNILGVVSDQGLNFQKLVKNDLKLTENNVFFFVDNIKLVYFFDVPQLLKSTRNNFFSYDFILPGGTTKKMYLDIFYNTDKLQEYRLCPKLTDEHIYPNNVQKIKVKYASQIFSHSVAAALSTYISFKVLPPDAKITATFIKTMNDLFDLLNSCHLYNFNAFVGTEKQLQVLDEFEILLKNLNVVNVEGKSVTNKLKFISGWKLTIKSTKALWGILKSKGYSFLHTRNLNLDCLHDFFGQVRNCRSNSTNPTPIQFCRAFKNITTLKLFDQVDDAHCMNDLNEVLISKSLDSTGNFKELLFPIPAPTNSIKVFTTDYRKLNSPGGNALLYIAEYLLKKCLLQHSCEVCLKFNEHDTLEEKATFFSKAKVYIDSEKLPFDGLAMPALNIIEYLIQLENIFIDYFNLGFNKLPSYNYCVGQRLKDLFKNVPFTHPCEHFPINYFLDLYIRVRIYYTIKFVNRDINNRKTAMKENEKANIKLKILKHL